MAESPEMNSSAHNSPAEESVAESSSAAQDQSDSGRASISLTFDQLKELLAVNTGPVSAEPDNNECEVAVDVHEDDPLSSDDESEILASPVEPKLASFIDSRLTEEQPKEKLKIKYSKASRPSNINFAKEVKVNKPVFRAMSVVARNKDKELRKIQNMTVKAVNNVAKVADAIMKKSKQNQPMFTEEEMKEIHSNIINGLGLMCQVSQHINSKRRVMLRGEINPKFSTLCTSDKIIPTDYLFGEESNIKEAMSECDVGAKLAMPKNYQGN